MSERDKQLLQCAGISVAEASIVLQRSRQTIYQGMAQEKDYFTMSQVAVILNWLKSRDAMFGFDALIAFAERALPEDVLWMLPHRLAQESLRNAWQGTEKIILAVNGNVGHLGSQSHVVTTLRNTLEDHGANLQVMIPAEWVGLYLQQQLQISCSCKVVNQKNLPLGKAMLLPFLVFFKEHRRRAFLFARSGPQEADDHTAMHLGDCVALEGLF